jgi:hypothetical protein
VVDWTVTGTGVNDDSDNCPTIANADQLNADNAVDGGNICDDDNDGVADIDDLFPLDNGESIDSDGDGIGENADSDNDNDNDNDGIADTEDAFPFDATETVDTDNDGIGNSVDTDDDGDGVADADDVFPLNANESVDTDLDGIGNNGDSDDDNDGMSDAWELTNGFNSLDASDANLDSDGDGHSNLSNFTLTMWPTPKTLLFPLVDL